MVAVAEVIESKSCSGPEAYFCRLIATEGLRPSRAYTVAWKTKTENAAMLAARVLARPHVASKLAELQAQADSEALLRRDERRAILADTARRTVRAAPSHSERIAAIREDAVLAGERTERVLGSVDIGLSAIIVALSAGTREIGSRFSSTTLAQGLDVNLPLSASGGNAQSVGGLSVGSHSEQKVLSSLTVVGQSESFGPMSDTLATPGPWVELE